MQLEHFGWTSFFEAYFFPYREEGLTAGRVAVQHRDRYVLYTEHGDLWGEVSGKFRFEVKGPDEFPAVGDWVAISARPEEEAATIHHVLPRKGKFSRKVAGTKTEEQILTANVDVVFLVSGLDGDFNPRRIERYLTVAWESGATPIIILNKADLCKNIEERTNEVESIAFGVSILTMSAARSEGVQQLLEFLPPGKTGALLGSSGVGKSTIINFLIGKERLKVQEVREDDSRGRHTTTHRELILLPSGGLLIDTPGMRELQLWGTGEGLQGTFEDIEELVRQCRFRDCQHQDEPDCAVKQALEDGSLDGERYKSYQKLQREMRYIAAKQNQKIMLERQRQWKKIGRLAKDAQKRKGKV